MLKWLLTVLVVLVILAAVAPWFGRLGLGRLPGDLRIPVRGRMYYVPFASTVLLSLLAWALAKLLWPLGDPRPHPYLRPRRLQSFRGFLLRDELLGDLERLGERARSRERVAEIRLAEVGEFAPCLAAERRAVRCGRGDDHRVVVAQGLDIPARVAGRDDDHAPLDPRVLEDAGERGGSQCGELERRLGGRKTVLAITVRRQEKEQRVLLGVHRLAHPVERAREVGHAADGEIPPARRGCSRGRWSAPRCRS